LLIWHNLLSVSRKVLDLVKGNNFEKKQIRKLED